MDLNILTLSYLIGSLTFIIGLKMLSNPASARKGNLMAAAGMAIAIVATIFHYRDENGNHLGNYGWIFGGLLVGSIIGTLAAKKVKMTSMPEMVSLFNGMGGACAALISIVEFGHYYSHGQTPMPEMLIIFIGLIIGSVSFAGSIVAWGKLNGSIKDFSFKGQHIFNMFLLAVIVVLTGYSLSQLSENLDLFFYTVLALSLLYGLMFVFPIGGADMPVVISLLNSFTGVAAACGGFLYDNKVMLTGGILVGAAGTLLTILMCKAMNRSLKNVLIGSFGSSVSSGDAVAKGPQGNYKEINLSDTAVVMSYAQRVIIVPGYGLAVAQAQHTVRELADLLAAKPLRV